mgnify:CR=1 FL=1
MQKQYQPLTGQKVEVAQVLGVVEAILGEEAKGQVLSALNAGLTPDQLQQAQKLFSGPEGRSKTDVSKQEILEATEKAHGETGVQTQPGENTSRQGSLSSDAQGRAQAAGETSESEDMEV